MNHRFQVQSTDGSGLLGVVVNHGRGWRFIPWVNINGTSSRKLHATPKDALKRFPAKSYELIEIANH